MKRIRIERSEGYYECGDGCCSEWFDGAKATLDGEVIFELPCERGNTLDDESMYIKILEHLGYKVEGDVDCLY